MNCIAKSQSSIAIDDDTNDSKNFFSLDFAPDNNHVLIGRGKRCSEHAGNKRLRRLVAYHLDQYSAATTKKEKTTILMSIVSHIRMGTPKQKGGFIKLDLNTGQWFEVSDFMAREKVSQAFRDALHNNYRSSNEFKKKRKREQSRSRFAKIMQSSKSSRVLQEPSSSVEQTEELQRQIDDRASNKYDDLLLSPSSLAVLSLESSIGMDGISINASKLRSFLPDSYSLTSWFEDDYYESNYNPFEPIPISANKNEELHYDGPLLPLPDDNFETFMEAIDDVSFSNDDYTSIFDDVTRVDETTVREPRNGYKAWNSHRPESPISQPSLNSCAARTA